MKWIAVPAALLLAGCHLVAPSPAVVVVTEVHNGKAVTVPIDGTLTITLTANPSTGFQWQVATAPADAVLMASGSGFDADTRTDRIGAPGEAWWNFKGVGRGSTALSLRYVRPWEPDRVAAQYTLLVEVR
jgi:inhibitor of cysteine peptidase